jgi:propanol-preferring alcohol dehydrogenase
MLAVRLHSLGTEPVLDEVPVPEPAGDEVLVRVAACGVCRTDLHIVEGSQPRVSPPVTLGHEIAGWVAAYGPSVVDAPLPIGTPVVVYGGWGCGTCSECGAGAEQRCAFGRSPGFQLDGGWAEYVLVPSARHLIPLPTSLDPVSSAPLADAGVTPYRAVERARPWLRPRARVLVIGFGALGQFALQYLRRLDLDVAVQDIDPRKLALARSLGAAVMPPAADASEAWDDTSSTAPALPDASQTSGGTKRRDLATSHAREASRHTGDSARALADASEAFQVVFDFVGTDATLAGAAALVSPGGLISIVGEGGGALPVSFDSPAVEVAVTTTAWGSLDDLRAVVTLAPELTWTTEPLPLRDYALALDRLANGDVSGRIVLVPQAST